MISHQLEIPIRTFIFLTKNLDIEYYNDIEYIRYDNKMHANVPITPSPIQLAGCAFVSDPTRNNIYKTFCSRNRIDTHKRALFLCHAFFPCQRKLKIRRIKIINKNNKN